MTTSLAPTLQAFFTERLITQRHASPHTVAAYRDTFRLLLGFAEDHLGKAPSKLCVNNLDADVIGAFLNHLEADRANSARTRNARLAAIHSFFRYAALRHPEHAAVIERVLAIPPKRFERHTVSFLTDPEVEALLDAPNRATWLGRRDHALLLTAIQTGLRVSELTSLRCADLVLSTGPHVRCVGKGRKERATPLTATTVNVLRAWLAERQADQANPLFVTSRGQALSRYGINAIIDRHLRTATGSCPSLASKIVTAHTLRHTAAMRLLLSGVDVTVIALWLGHERVSTTSIYLQADMSQKQRAIARTTPVGNKGSRYHASDKLLAFLERL